MWQKFLGTDYSSITWRSLSFINLEIKDCEAVYLHQLCTERQFSFQRGHSVRILQSPNPTSSLSKDWPPTPLRSGSLGLICLISVRKLKKDSHIFKEEKLNCMQHTIQYSWRFWFSPLIKILRNSSSAVLVNSNISASEENETKSPSPSDKKLRTLII